MQTNPITQLNLEQAIQLQFKLVDTIQRVFRGRELMDAGDYGITPEWGRPRATAKVERVLADFFGVEEAALVRGAGTGAMRYALNSLVTPGGKLMVHDAPVYSTTQNIIAEKGIQLISADMNRPENLSQSITTGIQAALIQHSRQKANDQYAMGVVINAIKSINKLLPVITDENYTVMKVPAIGAQLGADVSVFSLFKLLGPEGIGCVVGKAEIIRKIHQMNYSGGSQVQGPEAMEALRSLVYTPVALALQASQVDEIVQRLNRHEIDGVKAAYIANAQSRVVLVEFAVPIAINVLKRAEELGAVPYPVGSESRYEIGAMFYRVSGTFIRENPDLENYMIRINPMRAGADTVLRILGEAMDVEQSNI
ncbi:MAG TPA: aminotransferase [Firmicutes bacterium]|nr:aminotransferase [Bacillota bacterium]